MIIPCIDLMDGKVVQLIQGREKVLEAQSPEEMLSRFRGFKEIQVIDLDAALGRGSNIRIVKHLAKRSTIRAGGGVRTIERALELINDGVFRVIIGTATFSKERVDHGFLRSLASAVGAERIIIALDSKNGHVVVKGWQESTPWRALDVIRELEPYCSGFLCTCVDKEGMMEGTDLGWFDSLRKKTSHQLIAAGGISTLDDVKALTAMDIDCAIGMSIYTGRIGLDDLRVLNDQRAMRAQESASRL